MTATVRSVRVVMEADVAGYIRDMRRAGKETDAAFNRVAGQSDGAKKGLDGLGDSTKGVGEKTEKTTRQTKAYTLEMALAEERSTRLRKSLREQARAQLDLAEGIKRVDTNSQDLADSIKRVDTSSRGTDRQIDRLSGRLRLLADIGVTVGPALIPLGASTIPVLTGSLLGLLAAASGIGTAVLAFSGLGDAIKAIDEYRGERTAANLAAVRAEAEKLGPAGAEFARFIADLEPELQMLQQTARNGLLPGVEDGIESLLKRSPQITGIIEDLARGMGDLARDAGASLGGDDFDAFFDYLESDARPALESFARSIGNVTLGVANLLVGFAPASRDFTGGLEDMTKAFANWSKGLADNQSFQDFVGYIRQSGPQAVEFLGAMVSAVTGLLEAAAPVGNTVLPILTGIAKAFGAIAASPIGGGLYTAIAAFVAFNRVASITSRVSSSLTGTFDTAAGGLERLGVNSDKARSSLSRYAALGTGVVVVASAVGALADNINRINPENLDRSLTALGQGDVTDDVSKVIDSIEQLESNWNAIDLGEITSLGGLAGDSSLDKFANNIDQVDQKLAQMVESGNAEQAALLFARIQDLAEAKGVDPGDTAARFDQYAVALDNVAGAAAEARGGFTGLLDTLTATAAAAQDLSGEIAALNGWFDKRDAVRAYKDSIDTLRESLKDGFTRDDAANIDNIGRSILQVAENIKNPAARADFLAGARAQLVDLANNSGPRAAAALQEIIDKFDEKRLTNPPPLKLTADTKDAEAAFARSQRAAAEAGRTKTQFKITADSSAADRTLTDVDVRLRRTGQTRATPRVAVDAGNSLSLLGSIRAAIESLRDRKLNIITHYQTIGNKPKAPTPGGIADGGTVPGQRQPYGDKVLAQLAPGEEVISNRHGQADRFRADRATGRIPAYADGGSIGPVYTRSQPSGDTAESADRARDRTERGDGRRGVTVILQLEQATIASTKGLKGLKNEFKALERQSGRLEKATKRQEDAVDAATDAQEKAQGRYDQIASTTSGLLTSDVFDVDTSNPFSGGGQDAIGKLESDIANSKAFDDLLASLSGRGLGKAALEDASSKGLPALQVLAGYSDTDLARISALYDQRGQSVGGSAKATADLFAGEELAAANTALAEGNRLLGQTRDEVRENTRAVNQVRSAIDQASDSNRKGQDKNARDTGHEVKNAGAKGKRDRVYGGGTGGRRH